MCIVTEQFEVLAKTIMKARDVAESAAVLIKGQPEAVSDDELMRIADGVLEEVVERLTQKSGGHE